MNKNSKIVKSFLLVVDKNFTFDSAPDEVLTFYINYDENFNLFHIDDLEELVKLYENLGFKKIFFSDINLSITVGEFFDLLKIIKKLCPHEFI